MQASVWPITYKTIDPEFAKRVPEIKLFTLANGMRVLVMCDPKDRGTLAKVLVNAGTIHQGNDKRGLAHFVEHMVFQGTKRFKDSRTATDFLNDYNIVNNGYTSHSKQEFYVESDNDIESLQAAFSFLSEVTLRATLPTGKVAKEREVVLAERQASESEPMDVTMEAFTRHIHGDEHPYGGGGILGTQEDIAALTTADVEQFYKTYFTPANMLLVVVGGAEEQTYLRLVEDYFASELVAGEWQENKLLDQARQLQPHDSKLIKDFQHINSAIGLYFSETEVPFISPEYFALQIGAEVLNNRIFLDLRDEQGLAYSVGASLHDADHGYFFSMMGEFPIQAYAAARPQLEKYLTNLLTEPVTPDELRRALRRFKSTRWARSARRIAEYVAEWLFEHGQLISPEAFVADYEQIDLVQVNELLHKLLPSKTPEWIEVGKF
jgi:zinc protease